MLALNRCQPGFVKLLLEAVRLLLPALVAHAGCLELLSQLKRFLLVQASTRQHGDRVSVVMFALGMHEQ